MRPDPSPVEYVTRVEPDAMTVIVTGEIDMATVESFTRTVTGALTYDLPVRLDLGGVTFVDSSGLGALITLYNNAPGRVSITARSEPLTRLLEITALDDTIR